MGAPTTTADGSPLDFSCWTDGRDSTEGWIYAKPDRGQPWPIAAGATPTTESGDDCVHGQRGPRPTICRPARPRATPRRTTPSAKPGEPPAWTRSGAIPT